MGFTSLMHMMTRIRYVIAKIQKDEVYYFRVEIIRDNNTMHYWFDKDYDKATTFESERKARDIIERFKLTNCRIEEKYFF